MTIKSFAKKMYKKITFARVKTKAWDCERWRKKRGCEEEEAASK
jgi:hypothetical protein